jgi:hypothetical protein
MSDFFSGAVGAVTSGAQAIAQQFQPTSTSYKPKTIVGSVVCLGLVKDDATPFFFTENELPDELPFGRTQLSAVHTFIGGGRAIDNYGAVPMPIEMHGELFNLDGNPPIVQTKRGPKPRYIAGETAMQRMQRLDQLCHKGAKLIFQFHQFRWLVSVTSVQFVAVNWDNVKFTIRMEVISDNLDQGVKVDPLRAAPLNPRAQLTLLQQYTSLVKSAGSFLSQANSAIATATATAQLLKTNPGSLLLAGAQLLPGGIDVTHMIASATASYQNLSLFQSTLWPQHALDMANGQPYDTLDNSSFMKHLLPGNQAAKTALDSGLAWYYDYYSKLQPATPQSPFKLSPGLLAAVLRDGRMTSATMGQMQKTINLIIQPQRYVTKHYTNPNLCMVALENYDDASKWRIIADANGLTGVTFIGDYALRIPFPDQIGGSASSLTPSPTRGV